MRKTGENDANVKTRNCRGGLAVQPLTLAQDINAQLTTWFSQRLAGFSDEVVVTLRSPSTLLPGCEQPAFSMTGNAKLWGNVNVVARCANENVIYR